MNTTLTLPTNTFWDFSVQIYAHDEVKQACLSLQDRHQFNVNLLLLIFWMGTTGRGRLYSKEFERLQTCIQPWHQGVVEQLRLARRQLGAKIQLAIGQDFYRLILEEEIAAEQVEQLLLMDALVKVARPERPVWRNASDVVDSLKSYRQLTRIQFDEHDIEMLSQIFINCFPILTIADIEQLCDELK